MTTPEYVCASKVPFASRREARTAGKQMRGATVNVYTCPTCGRLHVTRMNRTVYKQSRRA